MVNFSCICQIVTLKKWETAFCIILRLLEEAPNFLSLYISLQSLDSKYLTLT